MKSYRLAIYGAFILLVALAITQCATSDEEQPLAAQEAAYTFTEGQTAGQVAEFVAGPASGTIDVWSDSLTNTAVDTVPLTGWLPGARRGNIRLDSVTISGTAAPTLTLYGAHYPMGHSDFYMQAVAHFDETGVSTSATAIGANELITVGTFLEADDTLTGTYFFRFYYAVISQTGTGVTRHHFYGVTYE